MSDATSRVPVPDNDLLDGRYRLIERLGHGGMATVWRGYDERLSRTVAVKVLDGPLLHDAAARTQILLEARALARLTHPHIAHVYDSGSTGDGVPYLVMELVDGPSLASVLATRQVLAWRTAVSVCAQVADALAAAHARGFVHRDVSAANVLLAPAGVKLIDFGICAIEGQPQTDADGQLLGTPAYVAPERLHARPVAPPADVYSVGMLLYRALSGRLPWDAATPTELLIAAQRTDPRPLPPVDGLPATTGSGHGPRRGGGRHRHRRDGMAGNCLGTGGRPGHRTGPRRTAARGRVGISALHRYLPDHRRHRQPLHRDHQPPQHRRGAPLWLAAGAGPARRPAHRHGPGR